MDVILVCIGNEILKGRTLNTNAHHMAGRLYASGFGVAGIRVIPDSEREILRTLEQCFEQTDIVICTGGLGPTRDDITKHAASRFFGRELVFDKKLYDELDRRFRRSGFKDGVPERSRGQAEVPRGARALPNTQGTAPGIFMEQEGKLLFLLPGVPAEMKCLLDEHVLPLLIERYREGRPSSALVRTVGVAESVIAERIERGLSERETELLNYYPHGGFVDIVIAEVEARGEFERGAVKRVAEHVFSELEDSVYSRDENTDLFDAIAGLLESRGETLGLAESCTGGLLAEMITDHPGASDWFEAAAVSYSNRTKSDMLGVPSELIENHGAVSEQVARAMAGGARECCGSDYGIGITGIAGPSGGTKDKPVGTVYIAVADEQQTDVQRFRFGGNRSLVRHRSAVKAAEMLWRRLKSRGAEE